MKKLLLILAIITLFAVPSYSATTTCLWVWNVDITAGASPDAPDEVHCTDGSGYTLMADSYVQQAGPGSSITVTVDTVLADNSTKSSDLVSTGTSVVIPQNANILDINFLGSANCTHFDAGGVFYYTFAGHADADRDTFILTAPSCFKVAVTDTDNVGIGSVIVWTRVQH